MSYALAFWKGDTPDAQSTYLLLTEGEGVPSGIEQVDSNSVLAACREAFASWAVNANSWTLRPDEDGNGPGFDLSLDDYLVQFSCYGLEGDHLNQIIEVMNGLGYPLFDPQTGERFRYS